MKKALIIIFFLIAWVARAQNPALFNKQFFFNPYSFNPAFAGINGQAEVNLVYRKQWVNFRDAPSTAGLSFQIPTSQRVVLGFNVFTDKEVLLKSSFFRASFTYVLPMGFQETLRFGLSGGIGMNSLNLSADELSTYDPVILEAAGNNSYADGNFGVMYQRRGLKIGFALTDIFSSDPFRPEAFNEFSFSNLKNRFYSASYRFDVSTLSTDIAVEPFLLYRQTADGLHNYWETMTLVYFNEALWTGAGYSQNKGLSLFLGFNVKEKLRFSYGYGFPPFRSSSSGSSSHEIQLALRFGRKFGSPSPITPLMNKYHREKPPRGKQ